MADVQRGALAVNTEQASTSTNTSQQQQQQQQQTRSNSRPKGQQEEDSPPASPASEFSDNTIDSDEDEIEDPPGMTNSEEPYPPPYSRHDMLHRTSSGYMRLMLQERQSSPSATATNERPALLTDQPRVIVSAPTPDGEQQPLLPRTVHYRKRQRRTARVWFAKVLCIVLTVLLLIIFVVIVAGAWGHWNRPPGSDEPPEKAPDNPSGIWEPDNLLLPRPECALGGRWKHNQVLTWSNKDSFKVQEVFDHVSKKVPGQVHGRVLVAPGPADQEDDIEVTMAMQSTNQAILDKYFVKSNKTGFEFGFHELKPKERFRLRDACTAVIINISVAKRVRLSMLNITTVTHAIELAPGLHLKLDHGMSLTSGGGAIAASKMDKFLSRRIHLHGDSGDITGVWPLYDLLSVRLNSGSANILVDPQEADRSAPKPAELMVNANSGNTAIKYQTGKLPHRNYVVDVNAVSGSVKGRYIHGSKTQILSNSGNVDVSLLPYLAENSQLETFAQSSNMNVTVESPIEAEIRGWLSAHTTIDGSITVRYPPEWTGEIHAESISGQLSVTGEDVEIIDDTRLGPLHVIEAKRGSSKRNQVMLQSTSGNVHSTFD